MIRWAMILSLSGRPGLVEVWSFNRDTGAAVKGVRGNILTLTDTTWVPLSQNDHRDEPGRRRP